MVGCCLFGSIGCNKSNSPTNRLPPETHEGLNTMGCVVDGRLFIPQEPSLSPYSYYGAHITPSPSYCLSLYWKDEPGDNTFSSIAVRLDSIQLTQGTTYILGARPIDSNFNWQQSANWATYNFNYQNYNTTATVAGTVTIDYYDSTAGIVAGKFQFDALDNYNDTVHVVNGRFDMALK